MRLAIVLVAVGLIAMGIGLPIAELEGGEVYDHDIRAEQVQEAESIDNSSLINWTDLGPNEQQAILRSYQQGESVTLTTEEPLPPTSALDFEEDHWTLVKADGVYLLVGTSEPHPRRVNTTINWFGYLVAAFGMVLVTAGAALEAREEESVFKGV